MASLVTWDTARYFEEEGAHQDGTSTFLDLLDKKERQNDGRLKANPRKIKNPELHIKISIQNSSPINSNAPPP